MKAKTYILIASMFMSFTSCQNLATEIEEEIQPEVPVKPTGPNQKVKVSIRSASGNANDINYPIYIYAFDSNGKEQAMQVLEDETKSLSLSLPPGTYTIDALSGVEGYTIPDAPTLQSKVTMSSVGKFSTTPLMVASNTVTVESTNITHNIILSYAVTSMKINLANVPSDVSSVKVNVSTQGQAISFDNQYSGTETVSIPCSKDANNVWSTGTVYLFPTQSASSSISIALTNASETVSYGFNYPSPLKAATPYQFSGTYKDNKMLNLTGEISANGWAETVEADFTFGPEGDGSVDYDSSADSYTVAALPAACSKWNNHIVAWVENVTATEEDAYLISTGEYSNVHCANHASYPREATNYAANYNEGGMTGWSIPTRSQAEEFVSRYYSDYLEPLNELIENVNGVTITQGRRYLCEDAKYAFTISSRPNFGSAGATTTYYLRFIKKVHLKKR